MNHNLDDLIIDEPEIESTKSKSVLSKVALIIIVLIVGIVISKLIISDKGDPVETVKDKELTQITDPSQTDPEIAKLATDDKLNGGGGSSFDKDLTPIKQDSTTQKEQEDDLSLEDSSFDSDYGFNTPPATQNLQTDQEPQDTAQVQTPAVTKPITKPATQQTTHPTQNIVKTKPKRTPHTAPKPATTTQKPVKRASLVGKYFIQVGSFSKKPSAKYLNSIKQKGYTPFIIRAGNLYKVRVGPFNSFADAKAKLPAVNSALSTQGFVVKYVKGR
jgi:cell division protein FtsN